LKATGTALEKVKAYNDANREVAILCNHKRTVAASHGASIDKMNERVCMSRDGLPRALIIL
jgi:DNA topoisomerase-1